MCITVFQEINKPQLHGADPKCSRSSGSSASPCLGCVGARGTQGPMDVGLPDHVLSVGKQTNFPVCVGFILNWAMEMSRWSGGALHDPESVLDLNVGMRCTRNGFRGHKMPLAVQFFMQDLGNVLLCLKTFLLHFLESSVTKLRLHLKSRRWEDREV